MNIKYSIRHNAPQNIFHFNIYLNQFLRYLITYKLAKYIKQLPHLDQRNLREHEHMKYPHIHFPHIPNFLPDSLIPTNNHSKELPGIVEKLSNTLDYILPNKRKWKDTQ